MTDTTSRDDGRRSPHAAEGDAKSQPLFRSSFSACSATPPSTDDNDRFQIPFPLGDNGLTEPQRQKTIEAYRQYIDRQVDSFIGYQANEHAAYAKQLSWMLDHHVNNIGDPFVEGNFTINSKEFERDVLDYFARLWHAKTPHDCHDGDSYWGYVLTMGSTEGNMYGLWNARDYLKGRALLADQDDPTRLLWVSAVRHSRTDNLDEQNADAPQADGTQSDNGFTPVAFYSEDTHYSFTKAVRVLGIQTFAELGNLLYEHDCPLGGRWPDEVPSLNGDDGPGSIDVEKLLTLVDFFASRGHPALVSLNLGSTFKGAYDPVAEIEPRIVQIMKKWGLYERVLHLPDGTTTTRHGFWIHVDGALGAAYLPYLRMCKERGDSRMAHVERVPEFDFGVKHVFSIAMSGHKWIGAPWPCGIYMTKVKYQLRPPSVPEYLGSPDTTFAGSRNGFSSVVLWERMARFTQAEQEDRALAAEALAGYAEAALNHLGTEIHRDLRARRTPLALTVRFLKPVDSIVFKYSLSTETFRGESTVDYAHLYVLPGITRELIDRFVDDLKQPGAFPAPAEQQVQTALSAAADGAPVGVPAQAGGKPASAVPLVGRGFQ